MATWEVPAHESGVNLLAFLKSRMPNLSSKQLKKAVDQNQCLINGRTERFASVLVGAGDQITLIEEDSKTASKAHFEPQRCLYEDEWLLIYDKPAQIASDDKLLTEGGPALTLVHRLDRDTTGVLIFAKTTEAFEKMKLLFKELKVTKTYLAIVDGSMQHPKGQVQNFLAIKHRYQGQAIWGEAKQGLPAMTKWKCEKQAKKASLLRCWPITGRTHQLRVHFSGMGHPILGDYQYGRQFVCSYRPARMLLHAETISFPHPYLDTLLEVHAAIPPDFQQALQHLELL